MTPYRELAEMPEEPEVKVKEPMKASTKAALATAACPTIWVAGSIGAYIQHMAAFDCFMFGMCSFMVSAILIVMGVGIYNFMLSYFSGNW